MTTSTDPRAAMRAPGVGGTVGVVMDQAGSENFPVASMLLPPRIRRHLLAIYGYARFVDDVGDESAGDRLVALDAAEHELDAALAGAATNPIFVQLEQTIHDCGLDRQTLVGLIEANRMDQVKRRYATFDELLAYCELSANPVGRLVLAVFGASNAVTLPLSDQVCTALQIVEHLQDVGEDFAAGRIYLPEEDLDRFGVSATDFAAPGAPAALRRVIAFEASRAAELLGSGARLGSYLRGSDRVAIAGFVGGGLAQLHALRRASYDVLGQTVKASKLRIAAESSKLLLSWAGR
jgi:squalene synthase HpnC